ncbi:MAG: pyrrolo-quinoline quinone, partial [Candidatus Hydrogenedentes bacterium]|nr:pyrrolo-quinoline quinone [Candidatus Hydrogenedentota bacterium]
YAIRTDAVGEITLDDDEMSNNAIVWSVRRDGSYMQTLMVYGDYLYNCRSNGQLFCFNARTGKRMYKVKLGPVGTAFSASAVAAHGRIYFTGEKGEIFVVKAGPEFELLSSNSMNEICMATPAISEGTLYFRTQHQLVAISE